MIYVSLALSLNGGESLFFVHIVEACKRANTQQGCRKQEGRERVGQNSGEETLDLWKRERDGAGNTEYTRWTAQGLSGRKAGNLKEVGLGGLSGVENIEDLDGG